MKKYESVEIEVSVVEEADIITTSPANRLNDSPFISVDDMGLLS